MNIRGRTLKASGCEKQTQNEYVPAVHGVYYDTNQQNSDGRFLKYDLPVFPLFLKYLLLTSLTDLNDFILFHITNILPGLWSRNCWFSPGSLLLPAYTFRPPLNKQNKKSGHNPSLTDCKAKAWHQ